MGAGLGSTIEVVGVLEPLALPRAVEAERENERLAKAAVAPVTTTVVPVEGRPVAHPSAAYTTRPAYAPTGTKRGWFDFEPRR